MAFGLPGATFVGVDLNERALARGRAYASELGLDNVDFATGDLEEAAGPAGDDGPFDYVIAHGVYSWVSPAARDNLLKTMAQLLQPNGVAYISYNAKPGGHLRQVTRELMQFATRYETDPQRIVAKARAAVRTVAQAQQDDDVFAAFLNEYLTKVLERSDAGVFHDDLEIHNDAVYLTDIAAHAHHHGLGFLAEAELHESSLGNLTPELEEALEAFEPRSELEQEQALDFLRLRMYRQTLWVHEHVEPHLPDPRRIDGLIAYSPMTALDGGDLNDTSLVTFEGKHGSRLRTDRPAVKWALARLGANWPAGIDTNELLGDDPDAVRQALLGAHAAGLLQLTTDKPAIATEGATVSPLARVQIARGDDAVTNLKHEHIPVTEDGRRAIASLELSKADLKRLRELALLTP
jgi:SAM-dependent methyltransferase